MATIRTAIQIHDGMTPGLRSITNALNMTISSFEALQTASGNAIDTASIQAARTELNRAELAFNEIEQQIREANQAQQQFNNDVRNGQGAADGLLGKLKSVAMSIGAAFGAKKIIELTDSMTSTNARLDLMNDGLQTTAELQNMIYASAQRSRTSYLDTAQAVAKLGILAKDAFSSNAEMVAFAEQMNKQFKIGGASIQEQTAAMYQLTQAMAAGRLQGDEFRSIMENAPMLAQALAEYTGKSIGELREMSSEGLITADVIKNAMFASADETNKKFAELPITFGQVWTSIKNKAIKAFDPVLTKISEITQNDDFEKLTNNIVGGIVIVASAAAWLFNIITKISSFISDNWSMIEPIILGIAAAMLLYNGALIANSVIQGINTAIQTVQAIAIATKTGVTIAQAAATNNLTIAQWALNSAMLASPITWVILGIIALIAVFYVVIAAVNKFAGTSVSATGIIMGAFAVLGAFILNLIVGAINAIIQFLWSRFVEPIISIIEFILNVANGGFDSFGDAVANLIGNIISWFLSLGKVVTKIIDAIFGTNWTAGLSSLQDSVLAWGKNENAITLDRTAPTINHRFEYGKAWNAGYSFGENLESKFDFSNILGGAANSLDAFELGNNLDGIYKSVDDTASNTASMKDSMDTTSEELKYMRDLAEQEVINRFTTAEIKVEMGGITNNVSKDTDLDGIMDYLANGLYEAMEVAAEGVHY